MPTEIYCTYCFRGRKSAMPTTLMTYAESTTVGVGLRTSMTIKCVQCGTHGAGSDYEAAEYRFLRACAERRWRDRGSLVWAILRALVGK